MTGPRVTAGDLAGLPSFVHPLSSGVTETDEDWELSREELAAINARCDEFALHRAQAEVSSRDYIVR